MAELNQNEQRSQKGKPRANGTSRPKRRGKLSTRIDMTPMVDLAFLLLTFFMLTTTFNKPKALEVNMPDTKNEGPVNHAVTILLGENNRICYYKDMFNPNDLSIFHKTNYSKNGIRKELLGLNTKLIDQISKIEEDLKNGLINDSIYKIRINEAKKDKNNDGIFVIIKATDKANLENLVTLLDEMKICNAKNYSIVDITKEEEKVFASLY